MDVKILVFLLYLKDLEKIIYKYLFNPIFLFFPLFLMFWGCANQLPPGGGDEDKIPPKIVSVTPEANSLNFKGNVIHLEFNEYVDRRSLQDAFRISPPYIGDIDYDWSGKDVDIVFSVPFWKKNENKTYVININSNLKDIHGNAIEKPFIFAFSTGQQIDKGSVSGRILNYNKKIISIFAYIVNPSDTAFNPTRRVADYITEISSDGSYILSNLAASTYRLIAVDDDDKNLLYTDREDFGVLNKDIVVTDISKNTADFYLYNFSTGDSSALGWKDYFSDSLNIVYSNIQNRAVNIPTDQSMFFFFNRKKPQREDFVTSFKLTDESNNTEKVVYNWKNDSLIEIFPVNKFKANTNYTASFTLLPSRDSAYIYSLKFKTASVHSYGDIKGNVMIDDITAPVYILLESVDIKPPVKYSFESQDTAFAFKSILEADYKIFSYVDLNRNGIYDYGNPYPFQFSEPFYIYPSNVGVKGGWTVDNIIIRF
jgi:hypothetical protein